MWIHEAVRKHWECEVLGWMRNVNFSLWLFVVCGLLTGCLIKPVTPVFAIYNARSLGLGGNYTALARGIEAPAWNPANLGLDFSEHHWSIRILDAGVQAFNDSYTRSDYERYNGQDISAAKQEILNAIHGQELDLFANAELALPGLAYKAFAFNIQALVVTEVELSKSLFELGLLGNTHDNRLEFSPLGGNGIAIWKISYSAARPIRLKGFQEAALGATINLYSGKSVFQVSHARGHVQTQSDAFSASGEIVLRNSMGGRGVGLDLGISGLYADHWYLSASFANVLNRIKWQRQSRLFRYQFTLNEINFDAFEDITGTDDWYQTVKDTVALSAFSTQLPEIFRFGLARSFDRWLFAMDYKQGLRDLAETSLNPEIGAGIEFTSARKLALRAGLALGGDLGYACAMGVGIRFRIFYCDLGWRWIGAFWPANARGYAFAFSSGLRF